MNTFKNKTENLSFSVSSGESRKIELGEVDGLIGDGDHGMNMNKGFSLFGSRFEQISFLTDSMNWEISSFQRLAALWAPFTELFSWMQPMPERDWKKSPFRTSLPCSAPG